MICPDCRTPEILGEMCDEITNYRNMEKHNPFLEDYVLKQGPEFRLTSLLPGLIEFMTGEQKEYQQCLYDYIARNAQFESEAKEYLAKYELPAHNSQIILYDLLRFYSRREFVKPGEYVEVIEKTTGLVPELYILAAEFLGMTAEYDRAEKLVLKVRGDIVTPLFYSEENVPAKYDEKLTEISKWRKTPYWPANAESREKLAAVYDAKGIPHKRISLKPKKVAENEFERIKESSEDQLSDYVTFWCREVFTTSAANDICEIAACSVSDGTIVGTFHQFIHPWNSSASAVKKAASDAGTTVQVLNEANDVDIVMKSFFEFVGSSKVLIGTEALGKQGKLLSRAARYTGMKRIDNEFLDILDIAADASDEFDLANNTREFLLSKFNIQNDTSAEEKARNNVTIYEKLKEMV